jgi:hypothetical protein
MNTVEPLRFEVEGKGIETDDNYQPRHSERFWPETHDFIFHKAAVELCDEISPYTLQEKYSEIMESEIEPLKDVLPLPEQQIRFGDISSGGPGHRIFYVRGETVIVPSRRHEGVIRLVSNNKNAARDLRGKLKSELENWADKFHGAGIEEIDITTATEFTLKNIRHPNAEIEVEAGEPDTFEKEVLDELTPLSESFVSNVEVNFTEYSPSPEFDILYTSSPHEIIQIEVKDYSGTDDEPGENDAIHQPLRRASLLDIGKTFTVLRGVEKERMDELKKNSDLRNQISIVEKHEITEAIQPILENSITGGPPLRFR